jgi:hypothetical protein
MLRPRRRLVLLLGAILSAAGFEAALAQQDFDFMPKGGRTLLVEVIGKVPDAQWLDRLSGSPRGEAQWQELLAGSAPSIGDREQRTLAAYLAVNLPVSRDALDAAIKDGDVGKALPPDGRELAWNGCQSCHSLFSGYLTQDRDLRGWENMFQSPFHRELKMTPRERDEFARYSAINMPMKFEDVPEDLRF